MSPAAKCDLADLWERISEGDEEAREAVILAHLRLVRKAARRAIWRNPGDADDIIQDGVLGLMRAIEGFNPGTGVMFSTFAYTWIRRTAERGHAMSRHTMSIPTKHQVRLSRLRAYCRRHGVEIEEAGQALGFGESEMGLIRDSLRAMRVLGDSGSPGEDGPAWRSGLADESQGEEAANDFARCEEVREVVGRLDSGHATVLRMLFGFSPFTKPLSGPEVARRLMISLGDVKKLKREGLAQVKEILEFSRSDAL